MLARNFFATFPQLEGIRFTHRWGGAIDTCSRFCMTFGKALGGKVVYVVGFTGLGVGASRFGARAALDLADGVDSELTRLRLVRTKPLPFPPEPIRWAGITLTRKELARADRTGRRGLWLQRARPHGPRLRQLAAPSGARAILRAVSTPARMPWSGASFLAYLGGFTILFATGALLGVLAGDRGAGGFVLLALLVLAVSLVLAFGALLTGHRVTAGLFALTAVVSVVVFAGSLLNWFGWLDNPDFALSGFDLARFFLELLAVVASAFALAVFRFPLFVLFLAASIYFLVADLISNGGDWTAILSILIGLVFLAAAVGIDLGESSYYGLWLHLVAGLVIGGGLLWFFHDGDVDFILVAVIALAYMAIGDGLARSSWIVLGAWGLLQTAEHFAAKWSSVGDILFFFLPFPLFPFQQPSFDETGSPSAHEWAGPLVFVAAGLLFMAVALFLARRRRDNVPTAGLL